MSTSENDLREMPVLSMLKEDSVNSADHTARSSTRHLPLPVPEKLSPGADFKVWELVTRRYASHFPAELQIDVVIGLLSSECLSKIADEDLPEDMEGLFNLLRRRLSGLHPALTYRREFHGYSQVRGKCLTEYLTQLRRLAHLGYPDEPQPAHEQRVLERFLTGITQTHAQREFGVHPPRTLEEAQASAEVMDSIEASLCSEMDAVSFSSWSPSVGPTVRMNRMPSPPSLDRVSPRRVHFDDRRRNRCYACGGTGHLARECANTRNQRGTNNGRSPTRNYPPRGTSPSKEARLP
ncbi:unnamed protein product [Calicophoron daubneyi]|uniref:CCHC-type domain-containing protein n=1 Tax=Calicophoron daubneyi TaxID=300641 RepID=A0AAV2TTP7_CALDB